MILVRRLMNGGSALLVRCVPRNCVAKAANLGRQFFALRWIVFQMPRLAIACKCRAVISNPAISLGYPPEQLRTL